MSFYSSYGHPMSDEQLAKQKLLAQQKGNAQRIKRQLKRKKRRIANLSRRKNR